MMQPTYDLKIEDYIPLTSPAELKKELPISELAHTTVTNGRQTIRRILKKEDKRLIVITGPCSIHDEKAAIEYAQRLVKLKAKVKDTLFVVMRVYFEKPRTTVGWKGLINDPGLDGTRDIEKGLRKARKLLLEITEMGIPTATEILDPIMPQYIAGMVCWSAIGARTTESQIHREMASGLSMPVGFKNCTDGDLSTALNALIASGSQQTFLGIDQNGRTAIVKTAGNSCVNLVLRGGSRPNYDSVSIHEALMRLRRQKLNDTIIVDCSHDNSRKNYEMQPMVWKDVINQRIDGNDAIVGLMVESNLHCGQQKKTGNLADMKYGVSITDACISWETTEELFLSTHALLTRANQKMKSPHAEKDAVRFRISGR